MLKADKITALYCRLSQEDMQVRDSGSIQNQKMMLQKYADEHHFFNTRFFVDDGFSGVSFEREGLQAMLREVEAGNVATVITKDLSRLGRNYLKTGELIEIIFPEYDVRYIAINDGVDTARDDNEFTPLRNWFNALYSKDISRKVSAALKTQMEQGTYRKRNLPYGYMWNDDHTSMVIDKETAQYVQLMFQWKIEGWSVPTILDELDRMGAPNPELRKRQTGVRNGNGCACKGWYSSTLSGILANPHYVGDTVLGRSMKAVYKNIPRHGVKDKDEWIVFPNTHEALISREDFQKVQDILSTASETRQAKMQKSREIRATLIDLFEGEIVCADCGKKMYFHRERVDKRKDGGWYAHYACSTAVSKRYEHCTLHYIRQDKLEADVFAAIRIQVKAALDYDKLLEKLRRSAGEQSIRDRHNAQITSLNLKLSGVAKKRTRLYEDFVEGILDEEEYSFAKRSYDEQYAGLSHCLDEALQRRSKFNEAMSVDNKWITLMKSVSTATQLSQDLVNESVEIVKVHEGGTVELVMKYGDIYALTLQSIKEVREVM